MRARALALAVPVSTFPEEFALLFSVCSVCLVEWLR